LEDIAICSVDDLRRLEAVDLWQRIGATSVLAAIERSAARYPGRAALTFLPDADPRTPAQVLTYTQLVEKIRQTANFFRDLGADEHTSVAFLLPPIPATWLVLWGAQTASRACPINYLLDVEHIRHLLIAAKARVLVALAPCAELDIWGKALALRETVPGLEHLIAVAPTADVSADVAAAEDVTDTALHVQLQRYPKDRLTFTRHITQNDVAALFHTGGTTGTPKLAQHTHGNQLHASWGAARMYRATPDDVMLNGFPLFHVAGAFVYGLSMLLTGAKVVLPTLLGMRNKAFVARYWEFVEREGVTLLAVVPTVMSALLSAPPHQANIRSARCALTGGSPLPTEVARAFETRFDMPVRNILGMTECAGVVSIIPVDIAREPGACGLPLPYSEIRAVRFGGSVEQGDFCAAGEPGILALRGPNVSPGYTDASRNAGTFEGQWLLTGDIGHVGADGQVYISGRAKDVIIRSSHNIDPRLIEDALLRHEAVEDAAAVGQPDEYAGELPVAFVTLRPGAEVDEAALLAFVTPHIGERPAVPKRLYIVDKIPVTPVGKIYKPALRLLAMEQVIRDRLAQGGDAATGISVQGQDHGSHLSITFYLSGAVADAQAAEHAIRTLMAAFAIDFEIKKSHDL